jgi:outer membrane protein assembly factor BamA
MIIQKLAILFPGRRTCRVLFVLYLLTLAGRPSLKAQQPGKGLEPEHNVVNPIDLIDVLRKWRKKEGGPRSSITVPGVSNLSLLPIVGYGPANGFVIGAAVGITELLGNPETTHLSSALLSASFTTKSQILLVMRNDLYLKDNKWYIPGDIRFLFFAQPTYGLGVYGLTNSTYEFNFGGIGITKSVTEQPMRFNYVRIYESVVREIFPKWYAGLGVNFDIHFNIQDQALKLDTPDAKITSHYLYSKLYGFDTARYSTNGLSLQFFYDSRDNSVNPYKGYYANLGFRVNSTVLGGSRNSGMLHYEWRNYLTLSKIRPRNILAFWTWGDFVVGGRVPYLALPSITWDTYGRSGRGYIQGRLRGDQMIYGEGEWRFSITSNDFLGGVVFVNATTASNPITGQSVFDAVAPGYGVGLRIMMNKKDRTNICVDYGRGIGSSGIYFNIRETF